MRLIIPISLIVIIIVLFSTVINPLYGEVKQLKNDVVVYTTALNNSTELQKTRDNLIETYKNIKNEDKDRLEHLLPSTVKNIELILEIEKIANTHGMPIKDVKFDTTKLESGDNSDPDKKIVAEYDRAESLPYGIFPMEFSVEGKYDVFVDFLKDLEKNLRLVDVKSISFIVPEKTTGVNENLDNYNYTLKIETYWLK